MVQISLQNSYEKVVFLGGSMEPPPLSTGVKVPWSLECLWGVCLKKKHPTQQQQQ